MPVSTKGAFSCYHSGECTALLALQSPIGRAAGALGSVCCHCRHLSNCCGITPQISCRLRRRHLSRCCHARRHITAAPVPAAAAPLPPLLLYLRYGHCFTPCWQLHCGAHPG